MTLTAIDCATDTPSAYPSTLHVRAHALHTDVSVAGGGTDAAPNPHDFFGAALASCKSLTAMWYAKRHGIPLERVDTHTEADDTDERKGVYRFKVRVTFHGPLSDEQRAQLDRAIEACPIHKLMTTSDVQIEMIR